MSKLRTTLRYLRFGVKHRKYIRFLREYRQSLKAPLTLANVELGKLGPQHPLFAQRVREFNQVAIELYKGRWYATRSLEAGSKEAWTQAVKCIRKVKKLSQQLLELLRSGSSEPLPCELSTIASDGTEISFADGVPLVPEICPVILLQGTDFEMGYQYAQQLVQIFGPWILKQKAGRAFSQEQLGYLRKWEVEIRKYAPELLELCRGWAAGASAAGIPMTYEDVLDLWTGHNPPAKDYFGIDLVLERLPSVACSGAAAWGRATVDGQLITGSSGDHDCTHMVTIVAFPKTGNNFIYTPFGATGGVPLVGPCYFFGHPGMNNKGLAYVHHGGGPKLIEPKAYWGYGLRRGVSVFHILRFAKSAREARQMETSYPIGDIGPSDLAHVGGFYADPTYGYVIESRKDPIIIREAGGMGETDFLYANNSAIHPDAEKAAWMQKSRDDWAWDEHGGWYPKRFVFYRLFGGASVEERVLSGLKTAYHNSCARNRYLFTMLQRGLARIDLDYMKMLYRRSGTLPPGNWKDIVATYNKTGEWGEVSTGNPSNAVVAVMKPAKGDDGIYAVCAGTARRGLAPSSPTTCNPIYNETNAFLELKLAANPGQLTEATRLRAQELIQKATRTLSKARFSEKTRKPLDELLARAQEELADGKRHEKAAQQAAADKAVYDWARATRAHTRAQVRALQVYEALVPPPNKPEDLGF